jgi:hypothetical protein
MRIERKLKKKTSACTQVREWEGKLVKITIYTMIIVIKAQEINVIS